MQRSHFSIPLFSIPLSWAAPPLLAGIALLSVPVPRGEAQVFPETPSEHLPPLVNAQQSVEFVSQDRAYRYSTPVSLYPGRSVMIDFRTDEVITFIQLSDLSQIVYQTNAPLESGQAKLIVLRKIQPLAFEGATGAPVPNLIVTTADPVGNQRTYTFNLVPESGQPLSNDINGVAIVPTSEAERERVAHRQNRRGTPAQTVSATTLETTMGNGSIHDFTLGLEVAIAAGYTPADDPIVALAQQVIRLSGRGVPFRQALEQADFPLEVAIALAEIGAEQRLRPRAESSGARDRDPLEPFIPTLEDREPIDLDSTLDPDSP